MITLDVADDATYQLMRTIEQARDSGTSTIQFEEGEYHFYPDKAIEKFLYMSNHNDVLTRIAFYLDNFDNLTIDGNGSKFIFHGRIVPFYIVQSDNITIKNLTIDCDEAYHSESTVVAHIRKNHTFDISISPEYPYEIRNEQLIFVKSYYEHNMAQSMTFDPSTRSTVYLAGPCEIQHRSAVQHEYHTNDFEYKYKTDSDDPYIIDRGYEVSLKATELKPGLVRISGQRGELPPVGMTLVVKGEQHKNRIAPAFKVDDTSDFVAENVVINHAGGMGFLFENSRDIYINKCSVTPSQGRIVSTAADATHFVGCRGLIHIEDCLFENQLDDALNVHGAYQEVMDIIDDHTLGIRMGHYQQLGFRLAFDGDTIGVVRLRDSFHPYHELTVKSQQFVNGRYNIITFNEKLPEKIEVGDLLENISAYPELLVEGCTVRRNRARGFLISTPKQCTLRNNFFSTEMEALLFPVESGHWYESGNASDVIIESNIFQDCVSGGLNHGVIRLHTDDKTGNIAFSNFVVRNNTFNHYDNRILELRNIDGFTFEGNTITYTATYPQLYPDNPVVSIEESKNTIFKNNSYQGRASRIFDCSNSETPNSL